ncbi:MAG: hypothetical protein J0L84_07065, partial [Verrucomicrobia bacterium]|nr:hypothetical protein [Verrucomicrobiota bacterium]
RFHPVGPTHLIVSGGGGIILYGMTELDPGSAFFEPRWHHVSVRLRGDRLRLVAVDWEGRAFDALEFSRTAGAGEDADGDGLGREAEEALGTHPERPDTDGDGLPDGWEFLRGIPPTERDDTPPERRLAAFLGSPVDRPLPELSAVREVSGVVQLRWLNFGPHRMELEESSSMQGPWHPVIHAGGDRVRPGMQHADLAAPGDRRYFRLRRLSPP